MIKYDGERIGEIEWSGACEEERETGIFNLKITCVVCCCSHFILVCLAGFTAVIEKFAASLSLSFVVVATFHRN